MTLWESIKQALHQCIKDHGSITLEFVGSAAKRIVDAIITNRPEDGSRLDTLIVNTMSVFQKAQTHKIRLRSVEVNNENQQLKQKIKKLEEQIKNFHSKLAGAEQRYKRSQTEKDNEKRGREKQKKINEKLLERLHRMRPEIYTPDWMG